MRKLSILLIALSAALCLSACGGKSRDDMPRAQCADGRDNDGDTLTDFPADPGCASAQDNDETDPPPPPACDDNLDNDGDGKIDFPVDPGCSSASDTDETDTAPTPACADGQDNDGDGKTDFPNDPGCDSASDTSEANPSPLPICSDGQDNDGDGKTDFPADPGCEFAADGDETNPVAAPTRTRYSMNNQCWALKANGNGNYVVRNGSGYTATATDIANAEPFYMKPSALGKYLFYNRNRQLMSVDTAPALANVATADATDNSEWTVTGVGDSTAYPPTPVYDREPSAAEVTTYHGFVDPNLEFSAFRIFNAASNRNLAVLASGALAANAPGSSPANESFSFEPLAADKCLEFPEARSDFSGEPFKGKRPDGKVLGHADVHVHISATTFLGGAHWGSPFHKFGVEHALGNCAAAHGDSGQLDLVGGVFTQDPDGHATDGWPSFSEWPARDNLIHEAIYWKWLERSWASGLRVVVNDLVDNETLCELQRNAAGTPLRDCNSMNNAGQQAGTMYAMQDYIDAQYGGRGQGFFQIVHDPEEARAVIEDGKMAVVLGIEISELFDCKLKYNPLRSERPHQETGSGGLENSYTCTRDSLVEQMERIHGWGVRQVISIHEFDNAFGGNGIFDGLILNLGNREDTGGIPSGDIATLVSLISADFNPELFQRFVENLPTTETATGEWWTTYDCPIENSTPDFSGYLWGSSGGALMNRFVIPEANQPISVFTPPFCVFTGQDGRPGGTTPCYPADKPQCNARWMTPIGLFMYGKLMEMGFLIDWDHMEMGMKTQLLELTEAQNPVYPIVSTHGTFGGATINQTTRQLKNGGYTYPSNGSSRGFRADMDETLGIYQSIPADQRPPVFGFGYGTDTNGLSAQTAPRGNIPAGKEVTYPFTLFDGGPFDALPQMFGNVQGVVFDMPQSRDLNGNVVRDWRQDRDGNAHHGMISDFVQEIVLEGSPEHIRHLFNSAEAYLQTWERTEAAKAAIKANGLKTPAAPILRQAPPLGLHAP
jgi:hypothetical protein